MSRTSEAALRFLLIGVSPRRGAALKSGFESAAEADGGQVFVAFEAPLLDASSVDAEALIVGCAAPDGPRRIAGLRERLPDMPIVAVLGGPQAGRASLGAAAIRAGAEQLFDPTRTRQAGRLALWRHLCARVAANRRLAVERAMTDRFVEALRHSVAHDLRGPVHVIRGFGEALIAGEIGEIDASAREYLQRMVAKAARMDGLVAALLAMASVSRGALASQRFDFVAAVRVAIEQAGHRGMRGEIVFEACEACELQADRSRLTAAFAAFFEEWFGGAVRPAARLRCVPRRAQGRVDFVLELNEPATAGPGLAALACIVERHDGELFQASLPGGGAAIRFSLPAAA